MSLYGVQPTFQPGPDGSLFVCIQEPSAPASRLALMEQHGLSLEHKLHCSAVSYKLLAALQSLCLPDADLSAHFQNWEAGKTDIRSRLTLDMLSVAAQTMLKHNLQLIESPIRACSDYSVAQHPLRLHNPAEAACDSITAEASLVRRYLHSQLTILTSNFAGLR